MSKRKKIAIPLILILLVTVSVCIVLAAGSYTDYIVTQAEGVPIYASTDKSVILTIAPMNTVLEARANSGEFVKVSYEGFSGWITADGIEKYPKDTDTTKVKSLEIITEPTKTEFWEDETLDTAGLAVVAVYTDGTKVKISGYTVSAPDMYSPGEKTVKVTWNGFTATYKITVNATPVEKIVITGYPQKLSYRLGDKLDCSDMVVTAYYSDDREPAQVTNYTLSGFDTNTLGEQKITVTYKTVSTAFFVSMNERIVVSLSVDVPPDKTTYYGTDFEIDTTGLVLTAMLDNGTSVQVQPESMRLTRAVTNGENTVELSYKGFTASYEITIMAKLATGISVSPPTKTEYAPGETTDWEGLIVYIEYNDGTKSPTDDYTVDEQGDTSTTGTKKITITYKTFESYFLIEVIANGKLGDANCDGKITAADARIVLRYSAGLISWAEGIDYCDVTGDGDVRANDARLILRYAADLEDSFPVERAVG